MTLCYIVLWEQFNKFGHCVDIDILTYMITLFHLMRTVCLTGVLKLSHGEGGYTGNAHVICSTAAVANAEKRQETQVCILARNSVEARFGEHDLNMCSLSVFNVRHPRMPLHPCRACHLTGRSRAMAKRARRGATATRKSEAVV